MSDNRNELIAQLAKKLNLSASQVQNAAARGDVDSLLQNSGCDNAQVKGILNDPEKIKQVMQSPQAQAIMKMLNQKE